MPPFTPVNKIINKVEGVGANEMKLASVNGAGGTAVAAVAHKDTENNDVSIIDNEAGTGAEKGYDSDDQMLTDTLSPSSDEASQPLITADDEDEDGENDDAKEPEDLAETFTEDGEDSSSSISDGDSSTLSPSPVVTKHARREPQTTTPILNIDDLTDAERLLLLLCEENVPFSEIAIILASRMGVYTPPSALRAKCLRLLVLLGWTTAEEACGGNVSIGQPQGRRTKKATRRKGKGRRKRCQGKTERRIETEDSGNDADVESNGGFS